MQSLVAGPPRGPASDIIFARLSSNAYEELDRAKLIEPTEPIQRRMTVWSHLVFAVGSVFARNDGELIRVSLTAPALSQS